MAIKCVKCNATSKYKQLENTKWRCPGCGHRFTANPRADGISDTAIKLSLDKVTADGTRHYVTEQLAYELSRRRGRRQRLAWVVKYPALAWGSVVIVPILLWSLGLSLSAALFLAAIMASVCGLRKLTWPKPLDAIGLSEKFETFNPSGYLLSANQVPPVAQMPALTDRVLICQHPRLVDLFQIDDFDLQYACPVIGPGGHGMERYPGLGEHIGRCAQLQVLVLHDLSPQGDAFMRQVSANPQWLNFGPDTKVIDLGLSTTHQDALRRETRPLQAFYWRDRGSRTLETAKGGHGVELLALGPLLMFASVGQAIEQEQPLVLAPAADPSSVSVDSGG